MMTIQEFCNWLARTPISVGLQSTPWAIPAVQTVHILCIAIVVTYNGMLDLRLMGVAGKSRTLAEMAGDFLPWIWWALAGLAVTGVIMIIGEPPRELLNQVFWLKMSLLAVVLGLTLFLQRVVKRDAQYWDATAARRKSAKVFAVVSLLLWVSILAAGRWIAYVQHG